MLTELKIKGLKAGDKPRKVADGAGSGLFLLVHPQGGKYWRIRFRVSGKEKFMSLGVYPAITLKEAREKAQEIRHQLSHGTDPTAAIDDGLNKDTFAGVAEEWLSQRKSNVAPATFRKDKLILEKHILPWLGDRPVGEISPLEILNTLKRIQSLNLGDTVTKSRTLVGQIVRYAILHGKAIQDPIPVLRGTLKAPVHKGMASSAESPEDTGALLRKLDNFRGTLQTKSLIKLLPLIFVRPGEARHMRWSEISFEEKTWRYTASKTKTEHLVPLSIQALAILEELKSLTGSSEWVFPGRSPGKPLSDGTINKAYVSLGIDTQSELTAHGWRSIARTQLHERLKFDPVIIEHQLGHKVSDALGTAYNRTRFIDDRILMMQAWADYLDRLKSGQS
ncbi:MAG: tyrosine-type recombinase/integrase [Burkholderiales bacterium]